MTVTERVRVVVEAVQKGFTKTLTNARNNVHGFNNVMGQNLEQFRRNIVPMKGMTNAGGRFAHRIRSMTHGMRGFRMEMLGVMFFGMGLQRFFTGLLKPALQLTGFFELWTTTLQVLFLPIAMYLLEKFLIPLAMWLMNLSDETKLLLGKFVLFGAILGTALFLVGMFALGIGSIIQAFGSLFNILDAVIPDINILGVNISSFVEAGLGIGAIVGTMELVKGGFKSLMGKFMEIPFVKDMVDKLRNAWNFDERFQSIKDWVAKVKLKVDEWLSKFKTDMKELGMEDLVGTMRDLHTSLKEIIPSLTTIARLIEKIASAWNRVFPPGLEVTPEAVNPSLRERVFGSPRFSIPGTTINQTNYITAATPDDVLKAVDSAMDKVLDRTNITSSGVT